MNLKWLIPAFVISLSSLHATQLKYLPNVPVRHHSEITLDVEQALPGTKLNIEAKQTIDADVAISGNESGGVLTIAPFDVTILLREFQTDLKINEASMTYNSSNGQDSLYTAQLSRLLNRPFHLRFENGVFQFEENTRSTEQLTKSLPILQQFHPQVFLMEMMQNLFILSGRDLTDGLEFTLPVTHDEGYPLPGNLQFIIEKVDDEEIRARYEGRISPSKMQVGALLQLGDVQKELLSLELEGNVKGRVSWNVANASLYHVEEHYVYSATLNIAEWEWKMKIFVNHRLHTK